MGIVSSKVTSPDIDASHTMQASPSSKEQRELPSWYSFTRAFLSGGNLRRVARLSHYGGLAQNTELGKRQVQVQPDEV